MTLVDTHGRGVERITEPGVVVDGVTYELDCLIFATGFEVGTDYCRRTGFELIGRDGLTLTEQLARRRAHLPRPDDARLPELLHREHRPGGVHGELPVPARRPGRRTSRGSSPGRWSTASPNSRPRPTAEAAWVDTVVAAVGGDRPSAPRPARPATTTARARPTPRPGRAASSSVAPTEYADILAAWRAAGDMAGLEIRAGHRMTSRRARRLYVLGRLRAATRRGRSPKVAIIGAGFGGLGAAVALRRAGVDDLVIIEGDDGVGGTWRRNTYPGAACDVQSHLYSFSFALNKSWSRTYARQPEILAYLESVADDFDLRRHLILRTRVRSARWNEDTASGNCNCGRRIATSPRRCAPTSWSAPSGCSRSPSCPTSRA